MKASRRSAGRQIPVHVEGHATHRVAGLVGHQFVRDVEARITKLDVLFGRVAGGAFGDQEHRLVPKQRLGQLDRIAHAAHGGDGADVEGRPIHQGGVELHFAVAVEHRAIAGIEGGIVLQDPDGGDHGVDRAAARPQHGLAGLERSQASDAVGLAALGLDCLRPAMNEQRPAFRHGLP